MKSEDLYQAIKERISIFNKKGFKKIGRSKFILDEKNTLTLQLDKWVWDPTYGTGFLCRVRNTDPDSTLNTFDSELDIAPAQLIAHNRINAMDFNKLYEKYPALRERVDMGFYAYYDQDNLDALLDLVLEPLLDEVVTCRFK